MDEIVMTHRSNSQRKRVIYQENSAGTLFHTISSVLYSSGVKIFARGTYNKKYIDNNIRKNKLS